MAKKFIERILYMNIVGRLQYAVDYIRPDVTYVIGQLARHLQKYGPDYYNMAKHMFSYLKGIADYWLILSGYKNNVIQGFTDTDGISTEGYKAILRYVF